MISNNNISVGEAMSISSCWITVGTILNIMISINKCTFSGKLQHLLLHYGVVKSVWMTLKSYAIITILGGRCAGWGRVGGKIYTQYSR